MFLEAGAEEGLMARDEDREDLGPEGGGPGLAPDGCGGEGETRPRKYQLHPHSDRAQVVQAQGVAREPEP